MNDIKVKLPYGHSYLEVTLPEQNVSGVFTRNDVPGLQDERAAIAQALRDPIGSQSLLSRLNADDKVVVIVTDNTRACPDDRILPVILAELEAKIARTNITIIVALGLHAAMSQAELAAKLGQDIVDNYTVINHDPAQTVNIGETSQGTPVEVHTAVIEADFRISTGFIEPHFFAGFSGGRKSIAPGVSSGRSIRTNHSARMLAHPLAGPGILDGNPVHEDMVEQARLAGLDFIVNVLLNADGEITHVVAGDFILAHEKGCRIERETAGVHLDSAVDIVLTTNSGAPLDLDFYQTCKGLDTAARLTRDGGIIIMVASCEKGIGPESFRELHANADGPQAVLRKIDGATNDGVGWQNQILARVQVNHQVFLLSNLEDKQAEEMMVTPIHSVEEGLEKARKILGPDATLAVIPEGPLVLPLVGK